jgi:hypothetical protein
MRHDWVAISFSRGNRSNCGRRWKPVPQKNDLRMNDPRMNAGQIWRARPKRPGRRWNASWKSP